MLASARPSFKNSSAHDSPAINAHYTHIENLSVEEGGGEFAGRARLEISRLVIHLECNATIEKNRAWRPRKKRWVPPPSTSFLHRGDFESVQLHSLDPSISELFSRVYESPPPDVEVFTSQTLAEIRIHRDQASKGHAESARRLHEIAVGSIRALEWVAIEKPDLFHPLASTNTTWPVLFLTFADSFRASIAKRLESIGFATKLGSSWIDALEVVKNLSPANAKNAKNTALLLINSIQSVRIAHSFATESTADQMLSLQGLPGVTENFRDELYDFHFRSAIGRFYANRLTIMPRHTLDLLQKMYSVA